MNIVELPRGEGIGPAPDRCTPKQKQAWNDLVLLVEPPGFLIWRDALWMELSAHMVAIARERTLEPEDVSNLCKMLKGLTLEPDSLKELGLDVEWLELPDDDEQLENLRTEGD